METRKATEAADDAWSVEHESPSLVNMIDSEQLHVD